MQFDVTVVHNQVLSQETLQNITINYIKLIVALETTHQSKDTFLVFFPFLCVLLDLDLSFAQLFVELFQVVLRIKHLAILCNLLK